jgi:hypothetical protein
VPELLARWWLATVFHDGTGDDVERQSPGVRRSLRAGQGRDVRSALHHVPRQPAHARESGPPPVPDLKDADWHRRVHQAHRLPPHLRRPARSHRCRHGSRAAPRLVVHAWRTVWCAGLEDHPFVVSGGPPGPGQPARVPAVHGQPDEGPHPRGELLARRHDLSPPRRDEDDPGRGLRDQVACTPRRPRRQTRSAERSQRWSGP